MEHFRIDEQLNRIELLDSRFYQDAEGNYFPSVTTILEAYPKGPAFYEWLKMVGDKADEIRDQFGKRGSTVHNLTEQYDKGANVSLMDEYGNARYTSMEWAMFERYVEFTERFKPEILMIEANYCSALLGYGGTLDRVIRLNGKVYLIDIKTSNYLHNHYWLQMAAYVNLYKDANEKFTNENAPDIDGIAILWLNAKTRTDGKGDAIQGQGWQLKMPDKSILDYWELFNATHELWKVEFGTMKPRNIVYQLTHVKNGDQEVEANSDHI